MSNQRNHFRIEYPKADRPRIKIDKTEFEVLDVSEHGIKFAGGGRFRGPPKTLVKGTILFKDGKSCDVVGVVLRHMKDTGDVAVKLSQGVPLAKMMEEQRVLLQKYKR
jgi:hypothetical protein